MNEVGVFLVLVAIIVAVVIGSISRAADNAAIQSGKADYYVKVAASGKGTTYHSLACNRSGGAVMLTLKEAQSKCYAPCSSCGGKPTVRMK